MVDRQIKISNNWALAADRLQWILQRKRRLRGKITWRGVWFVHTERKILERGMATKGVPPADAARLLAGLPGTFDEWKAQQERLEGGDSRKSDQPALPEPSE